MSLPDDCAVLGADGVDVADCGNGYGFAPEECEANARLIAAAPEMLESLRECHDLLVSAHMGTLIVGRARKAIA